MEVTKKRDVFVDVRDVSGLGGTFFTENGGYAESDPLRLLFGAMAASFWKTSLVDDRILTLTRLFSPRRRHDL